MKKTIKTAKRHMIGERKIMGVMVAIIATVGNVWATEAKSSEAGIEARMVSTTPGAEWKDSGAVAVEAFEGGKVYDVVVTDYAAQEMLGFGGCFNELGGKALLTLSKSERARVMEVLFDTEKGLGLRVCRTPVGANDFATEWYSYDETAGDLELRKFSIKHDKKYLIPYIKAAQKINPGLKIWASPWSAPLWMKRNGHYANKADAINKMLPSQEVPTGQDQMILEPEYLTAYSKYLSKYVDEYKKEGIDIYMLQFQNEPYTFNIWPNCSWTEGAMSEFLGKYLGPRFAAEHPEVELWLGTMNTNRIENVDKILGGENVAQYVKGIGVQWEGKDIVKVLTERYPGMPIMQTENECGNGSNDWPAAEHTFGLMRKYIGDGAGLYMYFNMVLGDDCRSTWGWKQNAMVVADSKTKSARFTPEYWVMKHFSHYVKEGAHRLVTMGNDRDLLAFENADGGRIVVVYNPEETEREISIAIGKEKAVRATLQPKSFNTLIIK